jgi:hypothetical protein
MKWAQQNKPGPEAFGSGLMIYGDVPFTRGIKIVLVLEKWGWGDGVLESCACCELHPH